MSIDSKRFAHLESNGSGKYIFTLGYYDEEKTVCFVDEHSFSNDNNEENEDSVPSWFECYIELERRYYMFLENLDSSNMYIDIKEVGEVEKDGKDWSCMCEQVWAIQQGFGLLELE